MKARFSALIFLVAALGGFSEPARAGACTVPGTHPSIQAAVDDPACSDIELSNQSYFELLDIDRSLSLFGPPAGDATVIGQVNVSGGATMAILNDFRIESGCANGALRIFGGARMTGSGMQVAHISGTPCGVELIFEDGFES